MSWFQRNRMRLLVVGLLVFSLLLFTSHMKERESRNWLDRALLWLTSPVQNAIVWSIDGVSDAWNSYVYLVGLREENIQLKKELDELRRANSRMAAMEVENQRLGKLVNMRDALGQDLFVAARVVGVGTSPVARTMRISAGSSDGVKTGDAVVAGAGLVGRVSEVVGGYAEVKMIVDGSSAVDAVIERSRARGIVRGQGEDEVCSVDYLVRTADVEVGDRMVTSGTGGVFADGLLVGTISRVTSPKAGVFRQAELRPAVEFQVLEEVIVVLTPDEPGEEGEGAP